MDHKNSQWAFITGLIVGGIGALCAIKIYNDEQEIERLKEEVSELTPDPTRDR